MTKLRVPPVTLAAQTTVLVLSVPIAYVLSAPPDDVKAIREVFLLRPERIEIVTSMRRHLATVAAAPVKNDNPSQAKLSSRLAAS